MNIYRMDIWSRVIGRSVAETNKRIDTENLESEIITRRIEADDSLYSLPTAPLQIIKIAIRNFSLKVY